MVILRKAAQTLQSDIQDTKKAKTNHKNALKTHELD